MSRKQPSAIEKVRATTLSQGCIKPDSYEVDDSFRPGKISPEGVHTTAELVALLKRDSNVKLEAIVLGATPNGVKSMRMNRAQFLESWDKGSKLQNTKKLRESFDGGFSGATSGNTVGHDFVPLIGGPFNKQLYLHDMLRMVSLAFHAYHHDPVARAITHITRDFTLGRGFRIDSKDEKALALWRAFEKANDLEVLFNFIAVELATYGEVFLWWLPDGQTKIEWALNPGQEAPHAPIPRVRLMDPSTVWEIITYPEDITRVIAYQQVFPTQYQMYTAKDGGSTVPSSKFIIQQVPAEQVDHIAINRMSNEKRGRSDFYPAFGYMKRLRDAVEYSIVALQKAAAWAIDTEIEGSQADLDAYVQSQEAQGSIAPAGSEFVHTKKIKRSYVSNQATAMSQGNVSAFEWCLNLICAAVQIPVSYLGTHLSGGQTKASALVGTEPVAKKFEMRQQVYRQILQGMWDRLMDGAGIKNSECEILFPEIIAQDATAKIKNLVLSNEIETLSHESMSVSIAQELGITNYDYKAEQAKILEEKKEDRNSDEVLIAPLTAKNKTAPGAPHATGAEPGDAPSKSSAVTKDDRRTADINQ